tara:strand:+ start:3399 stop:3620 length:222 start_codon:yes stop_codon:yes gene_type:complete
LKRPGEVHHSELRPVVADDSYLGAVDALVDPILSSYALLPPLKSSSFAGKIGEITIAYAQCNVKQKMAFAVPG